MKIFISATTAQFAACRDALASDLRAVGATEVKVQEDFRQGPGTLLEKLETYVADCDRVIVLVGDIFGAEPTSEEVPSGSPRRSYTQWEYFFAIGERLNGQRARRKDIFVYFASHDFFPTQPEIQDAEATQLQQLFIETIVKSGEDRQDFSSLAELRALVLRDGFRLPECLLKPCNLPYASLGRLFKGRDGFLSELHDRILKSLDADVRAKPVAITQTPWQAICGLGGIGKTRLAVEYALRYSSDYSALLFVLADSPEHLTSGVADLAIYLNLKEVSQQDEAVRFKAALRWMMEHPGWCLILDNVDDKTTAIMCEELVSKLYGGHVIITSRLTTWSMSGIEALDLDVLDASSARDLLLDRTPRRFKTALDSPAAENLASLLDGLALGLEQAGAFINAEQCSIPEYVGLWKSGSSEVTDWFDQQVMKYPKSVAVTWNATVQRMGPAAEGLLRLLACFAASPIPIKLFTTPGAQDIMKKFLAELCGQDEQLSPRSILTRLASYSMLKKQSDGVEQCIALHRVVHDITLRRIPEKQKAALLEVGAELFDAAAPHEADRFENWAVWRRFLPHAECLWSALHLYPKEHWNIRLLHGLALYYLGQNREKDGESLQRITYELMAERLGQKHPDTLEALNDLALLVDDPQEALTLLRKSLEGLEAAYLKDNRPRTEILMLASAYNIALCLNDGAESESLLRRCVAGFTTSPQAGINHWRTLLTNRALAYLLWRTGKVQEAEELARKTLTLSCENQELGPEHMDTLDSFSQMGNFLLANGKMNEALEFLRQEFTGREKSPELGPQHESTLKCFEKLIESLWTLGKKTEAEVLCSSRREQWREAIGAEHTNTLACTQLLVGVLALIGKISEARSAEVQLDLVLRRNHYYELQAKAGGENEELLSAMALLAATTRDSGNLKDADSLYRRLLDGLKHIKGDVDCDVAIELNNFGLLLRNAGKLEESLNSYREALAIDEKIRAQIDPNHPKIPHRLNNISMVLLMMERTEEAKDHLEKAWSLKKQLHDVTSARILWVCIAVALVAKEPFGVFLGQLKLLFDSQEFIVSNQVDDFWNVQSVLVYLHGKLSPEHMQLLTVLVDTLNASSHFHLEHPSSSAIVEVEKMSTTKLDDIDLWKNQEIVSLEKAW